MTTQKDDVPRMDEKIDEEKGKKGVDSEKSKQLQVLVCSHLFVSTNHASPTPQQIIRIKQKSNTRGL